MTLVYCIVVTYNGITWIEKSLQSLADSLIPVHVIVIDNGSRDGTVELIEGRFPKVELIKSLVNLGFAKANNIGIMKALDSNADYVFLLNQDAWIEKDTIKLLCKLESENPEFGILSPVQLNGGNTGLDLNFSRYLYQEYCPDFYSDLYMGKIKEIYKIKYVNAAAWLISRDCLLKVGLFEPLFFIYGEDINYAQRANYHGFSIGIATNTKIYHDREIREGKKNNTGNRIKIRTANLVMLLDINKKLTKCYFRFLELNLAKMMKSFLVLRFSSFFKYLFELLYFLLVIFIINQKRIRARNSWVGILS